MQTPDEAKRSRTAGFIFSKKQTLDFMCVRNNIAKNRDIIIYNRDIKTLKELAEKYDCKSDKINLLKQKDTIL